MCLFSFLSESKSRKCQDYCGLNGSFGRKDNESNLGKRRKKIFKEKNELSQSYEKSFKNAVTLTLYLVTLLKKNKDDKNSIIYPILIVIKIVVAINFIDRNRIKKSLIAQL